MTQRSGITVGKPFQTQDIGILNAQGPPKDMLAPKNPPGGVKGPVGLTSHNLDILDKP